MFGSRSDQEMPDRQSCLFGLVCPSRDLTLSIALDVGSKLQIQYVARETSENSNQVAYYMWMLRACVRRSSRVPTVSKTAVEENNVIGSYWRGGKYRN